MWDLNTNRLIDISAEKIRQDAALAILPCKWGKPVERQISAWRLQRLSEMVRWLQASERHKELQNTQQKTVLVANGTTPALQEPHEPESW